MYERLSYTTSAELCEQMARECDTAILAFSCGKDSIAAWLQMRKYFKHIVPYYCYIVPGLEFVEKSLSYYEDFFGCHIYRLPHRSLYRFLRGMVFQSPPHVTKIEATLAATLGVNPADVSVKPKTNEKLGFEGRGEGMSAQATVLLERIEA